MNADLNTPECQKYCFPLKSKTERKRILEAKEKLKGLYPFETSEKNILLDRSDKKGLYNIYVSQNEFKKKSHIKQTVILSLLSFLIILVIASAIRLGIKNEQKAVMAQKEKNLLEAEQKKRLEEKESSLEKLIKEYTNLINGQYEKIFPYLESIYSAMKDNATIENLFIDKTSFSVEVSSNDALRILENLEKSSKFNGVKMNRTTVNGNGKKETVTFSGLFVRLLPEEDLYLSLDKKIAFYEKEIQRLRERSKKQNEISLSEYIKNIRSILHKNKCSEQYIQIREREDSAEIEFYLFSTSKDIINFINEIQKEEGNLIDIKQIRIRNSETPDKIQTTIFFDSGIKSDNAQKKISEDDNRNFSSDEINRIFYKTPSPASPQKKQKSSVSVKENIKTKKLTFIGLTRVLGNTMILAKDEEMGSIYKLRKTDCQTEGDFCVETQDGYRARLRGNYYEVKR